MWCNEENRLECEELYLQPRWEQRASGEEEEKLSGGDTEQETARKQLNTAQNKLDVYSMREEKDR